MAEDNKSYSMAWFLAGLESVSALVGIPICAKKPVGRPARISRFRVRAPA